MSGNLPKCGQATNEIASCADWCYGVPDAEQPNHVCYNVFIGSIDHYIAAHLGLDEIHVGYELRWPTPMGVQELRKWYEEQETRRDRLSEFPYISTEFNQRWREVFGFGPPPSQHDERLRLFNDFPPEQVAAVQRWWREGLETPRIPPVWGAPPVTVPDGEYWLGFVVHRPVGRSMVWLLGLRGRTTADEFHGNNWQKWIHPVLQVESHAENVAEVDALGSTVRQLLAWYNEILFGKLFRGGGPPPWWETADDCHDEVVETIRACLRNTPSPTLQNVADRLHFSVSGLSVNLRRFGLKWNDLKKEAKTRK